MIPRRPDPGRRRPPSAPLRARPVGGTAAPGAVDAAVFGPDAFEPRTHDHERLRSEAQKIVRRLQRSGSDPGRRTDVGGEAALIRLLVEAGAVLSAGRDPIEIAALFISLAQMAVDGAYADGADPFVTLLAYWQKNADSLGRDGPGEGGESDRT